MVFFCEINKTGEEHIIINSCLLQLICRSFPDETVHVWIDQNHFKHFINRPLKIQPIYKTILSPKKSNKIQWVIKLLKEIFLISKIAFAAKRQKVPLVFFSSLSPVGNFYLSFIVPLVNQKTKFIVTLHGELGLIKTKRPLKFVEKVYKSLLKKSLKRGLKNRQFLILNKYIYDKILEMDVADEQQLMWIEHPYIFQDNQRNTTSTARYPVVFGHFGVAKLSKQSQLFFKLAESMEEQIKAGKVRFVMIGQVFEEMAPYLKDHVIYQKSSDLLSRELYDKMASEVHYSVFVYGDDYSLISSGSVIDTIAYEKPVIGIKNSALSILFDNSDCQSGYLFDNFNLMIHSMKNIVEDHSRLYDQFVCCIRQKKILFSIDTQLIPFKQQIDYFISS